MPDLRLRVRARRPVRQLWEPARPGRPDQPALEDRRDAASLQGDEPPLPRSTRLCRAADRVDRAAGPLASERAQLLARAAQGPEAEADHTRPRLGRADSGAARVRGTRRQPDLRLV